MNYRDPPDRTGVLVLDYTAATREREEREAREKSKTAISRRITSSSRSGVIDRNLHYEPTTSSLCPKCKLVTHAAPGKHGRRIARDSELLPGMVRGYVDCQGDLIEEECE